MVDNVLSDLQVPLLITILFFLFQKFNIIALNNHEV